MTTIDYKKERDNDIIAIKDSLHPRKVIVGGPGTGKSYLFSEILKKKKAEGKTNFLAITFVGKLGDALADDLCGLAKTTTMHGFARSFVIENRRGWTYYPRIYELIAEDFKTDGIEAFEIGDENYVRKSEHYKAVGDADVVYYAVQMCKEDENKIPKFDLILVDEYQDFNAVESEFVDLLAKKNEIVIVGDDDQALYGFKGSSPAFIREKYDLSNTNWESRMLRFCIRCTEVIIKYFHTLVARYNLNDVTESDPAKRRIEKEYICYLPDKESDSAVNSKIHLIKNCPVGMIAYKIRCELEKLAANQKVKEVLVIGEGQSCEALLKVIAQQLKNYGFKNVDHRGGSGVFPIRQGVVDAYKFLSKDGASLLGWRILGNPKNEPEKKKHLNNAKILSLLINGTPSELEKIKQTDISLLEDAIEDWGPSADTVITEDSDPEKLRETMRNSQGEAIRKDVFIRELKRTNLYLPRPLCNLDITVCNILNSKGLGADVVFLIGFDQGKFPSKKEPTESEIYQMLVAVTRAKKRIYLINTIKSKVSGLGDCLNVEDLDVEEIQTKSWSHKPKQLGVR